MVHSGGDIQLQGNKYDEGAPIQTFEGGTPQTTPRILKY